MKEIYKKSVSIILLLMFTTAIPTLAQTTLGNFNSFVASYNTQCQFGTAFWPLASSSNCRVDNWKQSHGNPSITPPQTSSANTNNSTNSVYMFARDNNQGEGMFLNYNFQAGIKYRISYKILTGPGRVDNTYIRLANGLIATGDPTGSTTYNFPSLSGLQLQTIGRKINYLNNINPTTNKLDFETCSIIFTPNANYSQLWIYPQKILLILGLIK